MIKALLVVCAFGDVACVQPVARLEVEVARAACRVPPIAFVHAGKAGVAKVVCVR